MDRFVCIHGHFYQPPRENPWLEEVELQDSAYPYHDWNERIAAECYAPNAASRIVDEENRILDLINNYSKISFNIGPTLCAWMERHEPEVLEAIVAADRMSKDRFAGHGSAIAQVYNHMIMPLANRADKFTQAYWGILDFERRFGRYPEGMWLPETAVDRETLEVLAELKIRFTILAPRQARRVRSLSKGGRWHEVGEGIDPTIPYLARLPSGNTINLFFYDGPISQDMAFSGLLNSGEGFAHRLLGAFSDSRERSQLVHVATDGESYGHHHRHGEMALSYCLHTIETSGAARLTNYGEFLALQPPTHEVEIHENSSWSCIHGIERWRENCGCNSGRQGWTQAWRRPLRDALDNLRDELIPLYEQEAGKFLADPWKARNDYHEVVLAYSRSAVERFLSRNALRVLSHEDTVHVLKLLEMQRNAMLMFTSCGWFFDEISGIETTQTLRYAARTMQIAEELFRNPVEERFVEVLGSAPSNVLENGASAYLLYAKQASLDLNRIAVHHAISSLFREHQQRSALYCYTIDTLAHQLDHAGKFTLSSGRVRVESTLTWESDVFSYAVLHFGDHNVNGGVRQFEGEEQFQSMQEEIRKEFDRGHMTEILQLMTKHFGINTYSLWHMFRDEQRVVINGVLKKGIDEVDAAMRQIYDQNYASMSFMQSLGHKIPGPLRSAAVHVVRKEVRDVLEEEDPSTAHLEHLLDLVKKWSFELNGEDLAVASSACVDRLAARLARAHRDIDLLERIHKLLVLLNELQVELTIWKAQNIFFSVILPLYGEESQRAARGDQRSAEWVRLVGDVGRLLHIRVG